MRDFQSTLDSRVLVKQEPDVKGLWRATRTGRKNEKTKEPTVKVWYGIEKTQLLTGIVTTRISGMDMPKGAVKGLQAMDLASTCIRKGAKNQL